MAKKKVTSRSKPVVNSKVGKQVTNGMGEAFGVPSNFFPANQGSPFTEQVSKVDSQFINLRWYLISNFRQLLNELYVELGLVQTIVDVPVDDALRGGITIKSKQLDEDQTHQLAIRLKRDNDITHVGQAAKWNRLFGGAGVLVITDQDPETPLDLDSLSKDTPLEFRSADMWELFFDMQNVSGFDPTGLSLDNGESEFYSYYGEKVHRSRVFPMRGIEAPSFIRPRLRGWGVSVCEKLVRGLNQYLKATDLSFEVLDEFKLDVFKIKNLANTLMQPQGEAKVKQRIQIANWQKNYQNAITMDAEDDFDHKQLSFAGIAETMKEIRMQIASEMRMPLTKIFGISAAGFNSGEDDIEVYNSMVESEIRSKIEPTLLKVCELKCQQLFGMVPDDLEIEFKPLRVLSAVQEEEVKTSKYNRVAQAKAAGEITTLEYREACNKGNLLDIQLDTIGDELNPDDPEVQGLLDGTAVDPNDESAEPGDLGNESRTPQMASKDAKEPKPPKEVKNSSAEFLKRAYQIDGGPSQFDDKRAPLFEDDYIFKDKSLYQEAKTLSQKVMGKHDWKFVLWYYRNEGGK